MTKKPMTSWERRRIRTKKITVWTVIFFCGALLGALAYFLLRPYETWDLEQFYTVSFTGYDGAGTVSAELDRQALNEAIDKLKQDHKTSLQLYHAREEDFAALAGSVQSMVLSTEDLHNGDEVSVTFSCDQTLAQKLRLRISSRNKTYTVEGLPAVTLLSSDDLFKDVEVLCSGISPEVQVEVKNNSSVPFLQQMTLQIEDEKEFYSKDEVITLCAYYDAEEALNEHYAVDTPSGECRKEYTVSAKESYVEDPDVLREDIISQAASVGLMAFTDANEYGVRIFCEAGLVPVYVDKKPTFEWVTPVSLSAYFKAPLDAYRGDSSFHHNDLDIIYKAAIKQANGVACNCYACVRFSDLILKEDGSVVMDLSDPKVLSADLKAENVKKTVVDACSATHAVTKVSER